MAREAVEQIKERLPIEDVIGSYVELKSTGTSMKGLCPFHSEKTPSFTVSPQRGSFYCFGCHKGGDIFTFVEEIEQLDFKGALKLLAERAGVTLAPSSQSDDKKERVLEVLETATRFFEATLQEKGKSALDYLQKRGVTPATTEHFRLGYAPEGWQNLTDHLRKAGYGDELIEAAGLALPGKRGLYDRFRHRLMFPIRDTSGRVIAFSGRTLGDDSAKYINSPETITFKKAETLYGLYEGKAAIRKYKFAILVEGQFDLILSHQIGYRNTVAASGTAFKSQETGGHPAVLHRLTKNLVLALDSDTAGYRAALRTAEDALQAGFSLKIASLPEGKDPADVIVESKEEWKECVKNSVAVITFALNSLAKEIDTNRRNQRLRDEVLLLVRALPDLEADAALKEISSNLAIDKTALRNELQKIISARKPQTQKSTLPPEETSVSTAADIAGSLQEIKAALTLLASLSVTEGERYQRDLDELVAKFKLTTPDINQEYLFSLEERYGSDTNLALDHTAAAFTRLRRLLLIREARQINTSRQEAELAGDAAKAETLLKAYVALQKEIQNLTFTHQSPPQT